MEIAATVLGTSILNNLSQNRYEPTQVFWVVLRIVKIQYVNSLCGSRNDD
jgi:hypothetical protein